MPFLGEGVKLQQIDESYWKTLADLEYQGRDELLTVPAGFCTNLASVPRFAWWLVPRSGRYTPAVVLHDYLARNPDDTNVGRCDADGIFRRSMRELGVPLLRRWMMWTAVRLAGGPHRCGLLVLLSVLVVSLLVAPVVVTGALVVSVLLAGFWLLELLVYVIWKLREKTGIWNPKHPAEHFPTFYWWT